jgi:16S rRNA (adenine1518-N6/adenine1519-N6)-dimethyltransferase
MSAIDDLPPLREVIRQHALSARKSLGQNFLLDLNLTARIARAAAPLEDSTIVEIGPGPGGLTRALLALGAKRVIAIEHDERAIPALQDISARYPDRLEIVHGDAMTFDPRPLLNGERAKIVANLPYNIATQLLIDISPSAFVPPPKVTSSVVRLVPRAEPLPCDRKLLEQVAAAAFGQRRKMLRQSLKSLQADPARLAAAAGVDATRRAETIPISGFVAMARELADIRKQAG